jgi:outer membrane protein
MVTTKFKVTQTLKGVCLLLSMLCLPHVAFSQEKPPASPLTLRQAIDIALKKNPERRAAFADTRAATADVDVARAALLPRLSFTEGAMLGNDPVYVFGSKLRQQRFTSGDFALNILNEPEPFGNFETRFDGTWTLFDSLGSWHAIARAERAKDAAGHELERAEQEIVFQVIDAYYGELLAKKQLNVAEQSLKSSEAILERAKNRYETGLAVQSDYLSAQVHDAARRQELVRARDDLALAQAQLSAALGVPIDGEMDLAGSLAEKNLPQPSLDAMEEQALKKRPDLNRVRSAEAAQKEGVSMARSAFGPRVNAYGGWELDNPTFVAGGGGSNWIAGIEIQFDLFQGGAKRAALSHEKAMEEKAAALKDAAADAIRMDVRRAYYDLDASRQQIEIARTAVAEADESLRIQQDRYDAGLLTIADLLAAEDAARRTQTDYWEAVSRYQTGYANLELAAGILSDESPVVMP